MYDSLCYTSTTAVAGIKKIALKPIDRDQFYINSTSSGLLSAPKLTEVKSIPDNALTDQGPLS